MKILKKVMSVVLVAAMLFAVVTSVSAYTYKGADTGAVNKTTNAAGTTYEYDFKAADGSLPAVTNYTGHNQSGTYSIAQDGLHFKGTVWTGTGQKSMVHEFKIWDPDFQVGSASSTAGLVIEAGHYYDITVEYSFTGNWKQVFVGRSWQGTNLGAYCTFLGQADGKLAGSYTYNYLIDGDGSVTLDGVTDPNAGRVACIGATYNTDFVFKKITVTVYDKEAFTASADDVNINFDAGMKDVYMPTNASGDGKGSYNGASLSIKKDPVSGSNRGNTLCATATVENNVGFSLPAKSGLGVYRDSVAPLTTAEGFKLQSGHSYRLSFDIYVDNKMGSEDTDGIRQIALYACDENHIGYNGGTKKGISSADFTDASVTEGWVRYTKDFYAGDDTSAAQYLMIVVSTYATPSGAEYSAKIYIDNIRLEDKHGMASGQAENVGRSIRAASGTGADYISAGIRFRCELPTATVEEATEVGFITAPETLVRAHTGSAAWFDMSSGKPAMASAQSIDTTNIIYGENGDNTQYQLLIRGLTRNGESVDLKDTYFVVVLYTKDADGNYTYYNVATSSYREVQNAYIGNDQSNDSKY